MELQALFSEPILEQQYLDPGYSGHANDVWRVRTSTEDVVVRAFRDEWGGNPFWDGCYHLFGIDPREIAEQEPLNAALNKLSPIPVPRVLRQGEEGGRAYIVVEHLPGRPVTDLRALAVQPLEELGVALAQIHRQRFDGFGHPTRKLYAPLAMFHTWMVDTMRRLVEEYCADDQQIVDALEPIRCAALELPDPEAGALVMVDLDPGQFLTDGQHLTAMVDTEAYVIGPRALDFIALEYVLDQGSAASIARGYTSVLPLPDLTQVRPVYRYLYRLFEVQGDVELDTWLAWPELFGF